MARLQDMDLNQHYTYADYFKWKFEERVELIKGKIFRMSPAPLSEHQYISQELAGAFWQFLKGKQCRVYSAPFDVRLPTKSVNDEDIVTVVQPDISVICDLAKIDKRGCLGAPDLVVEILSPSNSEKELKTKYDLYEESGVREYWVVSPGDKTLLKYVLDMSTGKYTASRALVISDTATSIVLPGFAVALKDVFPPDDDLK